MEKAKTAIEAAREFGVDIEQLRLLRGRTPIQRLRLMQSMARFIVMGRASIQNQKEQAKRERQARLRGVAPPTG